MTDISVIVPVFQPTDFGALIASYKGNTNDAAEWIVVDDGSGPDYAGVFAALPADMQLIRLPNNMRQGAARNAGLARAKGNWVKFLDADDQLDAGHLVKLQNAVDHLSTSAIPFAPTKHVFSRRATSTNNSWRDLPPDPRMQLSRQLVRPFLHHCGALFPRHLLCQLGGYDESLVTDEDGDLLLRVLQCGYHFVPVEEASYLYIHHDRSPRVSSDDDIAKMRSRIRVCDLFEARQSKPIPIDLAKPLAQRLDKIAQTYWQSFPTEAKDLLKRAKRLCPNYRPDMRLPLRLIRLIGGPGMVPVILGIYRKFQKLPAGGAQG